MKNTIIYIFAIIGTGSVLSSLFIGFHILRVYLGDQEESDEPNPPSAI